MSRVIVGYDQGRAIYRDEGPGYARIPGHSGSLVVGSRGLNDRDRKNSYAAKHREKVRTGRCAIDGPCRHADCVERRAVEARRLYATDLTLAQVGQKLGGRDHSTVSNLLRIADRVG